ncbi:MAG: hypothetical protein AABZ84_04335, partial [Pseudomonadota bacterium]
MRQTGNFSGFYALLAGLWLAIAPAGVSHAQDAGAQALVEQISASDLARYGSVRSLGLRSSAALVLDQREGVVLYGLNVDQQRPIASVTKLMTAMVTLDAQLPMDEEIAIVAQDRDNLRGSSSRLPIGTVLTRHDLLLAALAA